MSLHCVFQIVMIKKVYWQLFTFLSSADAASQSKLKRDNVRNELIRDRCNVSL